MEKRPETKTKCCKPELAKFKKNDPDNPINWTDRKKKFVIANVCLLACVGYVVRVAFSLSSDASFKVLCDFCLRTSLKIS